MPLGLLAGVVMARWRQSLHQTRNSRCALAVLPSRRTSVAFEALPSHIPAMQPDLSPEDCVAIAALLREVIAADRFPK